MAMFQDTADIFGSDSPDSDFASVFEKRRKRQTNNGEKMVRKRQTNNGEKMIDPFFDEVFTEQGEVGWKSQIHF